MAAKSKSKDTAGDTAAEKGAVGPGVATQEENAKLEHSRGGSTTRDDRHDLGVPMLPGSPDERQGPEDALGIGPKRGDYRDRLGPGYMPHESRPNPDHDPDDPDSPATIMEAQAPRTEDIGDAEGKKGGVETDPRS